MQVRRGQPGGRPRPIVRLLRSLHRVHGYAAQLARPQQQRAWVCAHRSANKASLAALAETKNECNELAGQISEVIGARALHGDIKQEAREASLRAFKEGKFAVLVATDVAARGLDISGVELVIQTSPPKDHETYIHRSGRTGDDFWRSARASLGLSCAGVDRRDMAMIRL